jgi:hypothetical protein
MWDLSVESCLVQDSGVAHIAYVVCLSHVGLGKDGSSGYQSDVSNAERGVRVCVCSRWDFLHDDSAGPGILSHNLGVRLELG